MRPKHTLSLFFSPTAFCLFLAPPVMPSAIYPDLLKDYANAPPLPTEKNADGKSLKNLVENTPRSAAYDTFPAPIASKGEENGFDFHIVRARTACRLDGGIGQPTDDLWFLVLLACLSASSGPAFSSLSQYYSKCSCVAMWVSVHRVDFHALIRR